MPLVAASVPALTYRGAVAADRYRFAWRPAWVAGHLLVLAAAVTMVFLGRWQLDVSDSKHFSLQNFGYALQWWAFTGFALAFWGKILHDRSRGRAPLGPAADAALDGAPADGAPGTDLAGAPAPAAEAAAADPEPIAYRRYVMPSRVDETDPEIASYNAYLASLAEGAQRGEGTKR